MCPYNGPNHILLDLKGLEKSYLVPLPKRIEGSRLWQKKILKGRKWGQAIFSDVAKNNEEVKALLNPPEFYVSDLPTLIIYFIL